MAPRRSRRQPRRGRRRRPDRRRRSEPNDAAGTPPPPPPTSAPPSSPPASRTARALLYAAARTAWAAGQTTTARALSAAARELADDRVLRADIDRLRGRIEVNVGSATDAHHIFAAAARAVLADDPTRALELAVAAALLSTYGADSGTALDTVTSTQPPSPPTPSQPHHLGATPRTRCLGHLLLALTRAAAHDWAPALTSLRDALEVGADIGDLDLLSHLGNAALHLGDDEAHHRCFTAMAAGARDAGAGMLVLYALPRLGFTQLVTGRWSALRGSAEEALSLSASTGQPALAAAPLGWVTVLAALQGAPAADYDQLLTDLDDGGPAAARRACRPRPRPHPLGTGHPRSPRRRHPRSAAPPRQPPHQRHQPPDRGRPHRRRRPRRRPRAGRSLGQGARPFAEGTGWPWALAAVDHGRALLAEPPDAPALFETALTHHADAVAQGGGRPYDRARTHLAYGELLRRTQHRVDARTHLRAALETFEDLRAEPLAARASQELRASGETARKRDPSTQLTLTPMERQVAGLVGQGLSNKDIAAQCWVSPRTVAFHLRNIFTKAGVTSRGELAQLDLG